MKHLYVLFLMLTIFCSAFSQSRTNFSGNVYNAQSQPLSGATVSLLNTNYTVITNNAGMFTFKDVPAGRYTLRVSNVAYAAVNQQVVIGRDQLVKITLNQVENRLDEVVVTAQKREEEVQQVPISISTLSAKQVEEYRIWNLRDITAVVPNLYSANPGDNRNVTGVRGVATTSYDPAIATYIDGVNQFGLDTYIPQLFDVERVEVINVSPSNQQTKQRVLHKPILAAMGNNVTALVCVRP
jgi:iron complex outermembrane receptor protein